MSVSKYAYTPEFCDSEPCPGDCDLCPTRDFIMEKEIEKMDKEKKYTYQIIFRVEHNGKFAASEAVLFNMESDQDVCVDNNIEYIKDVDHGATFFRLFLDIPKEG